MALQINYFRLYFIWVETHPDFLTEADGEQSTNLPLGFIGDKDKYVKAFEDALLEKGPKDLQVPWEPGSKKHYFWTHYLENTVVPGIKSGTKAWRKLVPFRWKVPVEDAKLPCKPGKLNIEAFLQTSVRSPCILFAMRGKSIRRRCSTQRLRDTPCG